MPDTSPTPVDLDAIEREFLQMCPSCDIGQDAACECSPRDPRSTIESLVIEVRELRSRASIGPDKVTVDREALEVMLAYSIAPRSEKLAVRYFDAAEIIRAALSGPPEETQP